MKAVRLLMKAARLLMGVYQRIYRCHKSHRPFPPPNVSARPRARVCRVGLVRVCVCRVGVARVCVCVVYVCVCAWWVWGVGMLGVSGARCAAGDAQSQRQKVGYLLSRGSLGNGMQGTGVTPRNLKRGPGPDVFGWTRHGVRERRRHDASERETDREV